MKHSIIKSLAVLMAACLPAVASAQYFEVGGIVYGITSGQTVEVQPYYNLLNNPNSGAVTNPNHLLLPRRTLKRPKYLWL